MKVPDRVEPVRGLHVPVPVGLEHRVGIDRQLSNDLLGRRELITRLEETQLQRLVDLLDQL